MCDSIEGVTKPQICPSWEGWLSLSPCPIPVPVPALPGGFLAAPGLCSPGQSRESSGKLENLAFLASFLFVFGILFWFFGGGGCCCFGWVLGSFLVFLWVFRLVGWFWFRMVWFFGSVLFFVFLWDRGRKLPEGDDPTLCVIPTPPSPALGEPAALPALGNYPGEKQQDISHFPPLLHCPG